MIEPNIGSITSFILDMPLELQILLLSSIVCGVVFLVSEKVSKNKNDNLNPFSLTVDLTAKQIKQLKEYKYNDKH
jgi:ABC-type thiamin/hydroxymethylpyrimidine transport system permease subunit